MKKSKPVLKTLRDSTSPLVKSESHSGENAEQKVSLSESLKALSWPSALPRPGEFVDFGDTPLSSALNDHKALTESQMAANWANSPIVSSIRAPKLDVSPTREHRQANDDSAQKNTLPIETLTEDIPSGPQVETSATYIGSLPPPPPPPLYKMTANGEQICTQESLSAAWDRWYGVAESWWRAFPNYPPPPMHPEKMSDRPYTTDQWFQRVDFWWSYMQAMYFSPGNSSVMPSHQYVAHVLDRACPGN